MGRLDGKIIFMTAAAAGIGGACATAFAREGARVIATDRDAAGIAKKGAELDAISPGHEAYPLDVTDHAALRAAAERHKGVNVLYNGAGWVHQGMLGNTSLDDSQDNNSNQRNDYSTNTNQNNSINVAARVNVTDQSLGSNVSDLGVSGDDSGPGAGVRTGDISNSGGAFQRWAGIQTGTTNTGVAANNLAATAVLADANVSFGSSNGGSH